MSNPQGENNTRYRLQRLEEDVRSLQQGRPEVIADRVTRMGDDLKGLRQQNSEEHAILRREMHEEVDDVKAEQASQRKILIGFFVSFALLAIGIALSYLLGGGSAAG